MKYKIMHCFYEPDLYHSIYTNIYEKNKIVYMFGTISLIREDEDVNIYYHSNNIKKKLFGVPVRENYSRYDLDDI